MSKREPIPSAHDVARAAGVSQAAVSRAFTPGASISVATRTKVLDAAKALGYSPNLLARSLITGKSGIVGVVIGDARNTFYLEALDALSARLAEAGLHLLVFTDRAGGSSDGLVEALLRFRVDSLLMMSVTLSPEMAEQCRAKGIPVIYFNHRASIDKGFPSVTGANFLGAGCVAEHLMAQGYRRLAVISGSESSSISREREAGFVSKVVASGLPIPEKAVGGYGRGAVPAARQLLSSSPRPDAIFCISDMIALATIEVARFEFGIEPGRDIGIAGFDNIEGASWLSFDLTTYTLPVEEMIKKTTEIILNPSAFSGDTHIEVEGELIVRASTRRS